MTRVKDLQSGDLVVQYGIPLDGVFVAQAPHPSYPGLQLVIWKLSDGSWSLDALLAEQEVGDVVPAVGQERGMRLWKVFRGPMEKIVGYKICGQLWHPEDVTIVREEGKTV